MLNDLSDRTKTIIAIAMKDIKIYYFKPPVLMFGIIWPVFMFLSFLVRRNLQPNVIFGGLAAITLFFMSSSIGPVVIPIERRQGTYDRLLSAPISLFGLIIAKTIPGLVFGITIALIPLIIGLIYGASISSLFSLIVGFVFGALSFSALGIMFSSFQAEKTGSVMMGTNIVRLPALFVSGIFIPLEELPSVVLPISFFSPLTYTNDLIGWGLSQETYFPWIIDIIALSLFSILFIFISLRLHERTRINY